MKSTRKKFLGIMLLLVVLLGIGITVFAAYGSDDDIHKYYFALDRIPGNGGYPGQALDRDVAVADLRNKGGGGFDGDMWEDLSYYTVDVKRNGSSTADTTIKPDSTYTYIIHVYCDDDYDVVHYGRGGVEVWWNWQKYNTTYDAGHSNTDDEYTWSRFGFTTPMTCSEYSFATATTETLTYNGEEQKLLNNDSTNSSDRVTMSYKVDDGNWTTDVNAVTAKDAGEHTIYYKAEGAGLDDRKENTGSYSVTINKLDVTVTPKLDQSKIYGMKDPTFTYDIVATNGAKVVPEVDLADGALKNGALSRAEGEDYTKNGYKYTIGTLQSDNSINYDITFVDNTTVFMINRKNITEEGVDITLQPTPPTGGYDGSIYQYNYTGEEIVPQISLIYSGAEVDSIKNEKLELSNDYNITDGKTVREYINHGDAKETINIRGIGNYIGVSSLDWRVVKLNFGDITANNYDAVYDGQAHGISVNLTDTAVAADAEITYIYDDSNTVYNADNWDESKATTKVPTFKDVIVDSNNNAVNRTVYYRVHSENKDGGDSYIYNDYYGSGTVLIKKKDVNLVAENKTKVYDKDATTDPELTYEDYANQMIGNETLTGIKLTRPEGQNVNNYTISFNLDEINKNNTNYAVTQTTGTFAITKRPVKVSVGDYSKIYSEINPTLKLTIEKSGAEGVAEKEGLLTGDVLTDESALGTTLSFEDADGGKWTYDRFIDAGKYTIKRGTLDNQNYEIAFTDGSFTVNQKDISLADTNVEMLYNGTRTDSVYTYTGKTIAPDFTMSDVQEEVQYVNHDGDIDYEVKGVFKASDYGIFHVSIRGIHNYTGEIKGLWAILPVVDKELTYDGNAHSLEFNLGESLNDGTILGIRFSEKEPVGPVTAESYELTECPSYTKPGVYDIYYGIVRNPEEYGSEGVFSGVATLTINPDEEVNAVEAKIDEIGKVEYTDASKAKIDEARAAYDALTDGQKNIVTNADTLFAAETTYSNVKNADEKINAIGTVEYTIASKTKLDEARAAYDALTKEEKALLSDETKATLTKAEADYAELKAIHETAEAVKAKIDEIGTVEYTDASKEKIDEARAAYDALTPDQKVLVDNVDTLVAAEVTYAGLKTDTEAVEFVKDKIDEIGDVEYTNASKAKINEARAAYDALPDRLKGEIDNLDTLTNAESTYNTLKTNHEAAETVEEKINAIGDAKSTEEYKTKIDEARAAYDSLTDEQKDLVKDEILTVLEKAEENYPVVKDVEEMIKAIGDVEYTDASKEKIDEARAAYDALPDRLKGEIDNLDTLTNAESTYNTLKTNHEAAEAVEEKINAIGDLELSAKSKSEIDEARAAYDALTDEQKALVNEDKLKDLEQAESEYQTLIDNNKLMITYISTEKMSTDKIEDLVIVANGELENLVEILVNGETLDPKNYTLASGSTILTLKESYLASLDAGKYDVTFVYNDGRTVDSQFEIVKADENKSNNPNTGDSITLWICLALVSMLGIISTNKLTKKMKRSK